MNKKVSVMLVLVALMFALIPLSSATSKTFIVPDGGSNDVWIYLGTGVTVNITILISNMSDNYDKSGGITFGVTDPHGNNAVNYDIPCGSGIASRSYAFSPPEHGGYTFYFKQYSNLTQPQLNLDSAKSVTIDYTINRDKSIDPISMYILLGITFTVLAIVGIAVIRLAIIKRPSIPIVQNKPDRALFDAMLTKKASEISIQRDSMNVTFDDREKGILLRCGNAWLSTSQFYYNRSFWQITSMSKALVQDNDSIAIQFIDGTSNVFKLAPDENVILAATRLSVLNRQVGDEALKAYQEARIQQWAESINMLIYKDAYQGPLCCCKYCKAENYAEDHQCINCGAPL